MPIACRLDWVANEILNGRDAHIAFGSARDAGKLKVKIVLFPTYDLPPIVRDSLIMTINFVRAFLDNGFIVVDRGHKHSNGVSDIAIWIQSADPVPAVSPQMYLQHTELRADADPFGPSLISGEEIRSFVSDGVSVTCANLPTYLRGQWETLPDPGWKRIYKRFEHSEASIALRSCCEFASAFFSRSDDIRNVMTHCSDTQWGTCLLNLLTKAEDMYRTIRDIDHSRESLLLNHERVLEIRDLVMECTEKCQQLALLIDCYPRKPMKRYKFVHPTDLSNCHYSDLELADEILQMDMSRKDMLMPILVERYWSNHTWMSKTEIAGIDPLYLVRQLRPRDRLHIDHAVFDSMRD
eukprot:TRINITY_DN4848_c0_g1_i1.p1 TRINITY_DN4848_c0_g1~~TRINITY_DN4848_c0_g1_i1.p1  ORF type:complete len:352 (+),score=30.34 TRINITY_DN4848_c0_g1_i1:65-1120(+)